MSTNGLDEYWVPEHVKDYLREGLLAEDWVRASPGRHVAVDPQLEQLDVGMCPRGQESLP